MKKPFFILMASVLSVSANPTYYDWSGSAFATDTNGTARAADADPDGDQLRNAEEYAFLTDPLSANVSPSTIGESNGAVYIGFPWNNGAVDLEWQMEQASTLGSNDWNTVTNLNVESTPNGNLDNLRVQPLGDLGGTGFFRLKTSVAEPELILDALEGGAGWLTFNQATFTTLSGELLPEVGVEFFKHSVGANWSHSGFFKPTNLVLREGSYFVTLLVGHDGASRPFATGNITLGFFDSANSVVGKAADIRDAVNAFSALPGVSRVELATPVPSNGWEEWRIEYIIDPGSSAIGRTVNFGIHAQSREDGGNQAMFDGLSIALSDFASTVSVHAATDVAMVDPLMFGVNLVYHKQVIDAAFSNAFTACGADLLRYPGGSICESEFDYLDSDGPGNDRPSLAETIAFCNATASELVLVVPSKRFAADPAAGAQYAADYVRAVNIDGDFGNIKVTYWELGNEYYASPAGAPAISAAQYAELAGQMAAAMLAVDPSIKPVVQFKRTSGSETQQIADDLAASTNAGTVKACLTHVYPWTNNFEAISQVDVPDQLATARQMYGLDDLLITEWNIGSTYAPTGMELASYQLPLFESLLRGGASKTALWPLSWTNNGIKTVLSNYNTGELRPPGVVFSRLAQWAKGAVLVQSGYDFGTCAVSAYRRGDTELTLFIACRDLPAAALVRIAIEDFAFTSIEAERIGADDEGSHNPPESTPMEVRRSGNHLYFNANGLYDWEVLRVTLRN